ncbi:MAG: GAF domain-containing protein, partial [Calditrichaeota bacterium]|nr:GAF domain-containing protein [Calditrichota bacterium]
MSTVNPYDALLQISEEIGSVHDTAELLDRITDIAMGVLKAERGFMLLKSGNSGFSATTARNISQESISGIQNLSSSVVNQVLENGEPVLTFDAQSDSRFASAESVVIQQIRSIACTPLLRKNEVIGAIYMDSRINTEQFNDESLQFLQAFARQAALAIENARLFEKLQTENRQLKKQISLSTVFDAMVGASPQFRKALAVAAKAARGHGGVLIEGESGTG